MPERYVKLSEVVEALRAESRRRHENEDLGRGFYGEGGASIHAAAADFLASSGLVVVGIEGWAWEFGGNGIPDCTSWAVYDVDPRPAIKDAGVDGIDLRPAILLLPAEEGE